MAKKKSIEAETVNEADLDTIEPLSVEEHLADLEHRLAHLERELRVKAKPRNG